MNIVNSLQFNNNSILRAVTFNNSTVCPQNKYVYRFYLVLRMFTFLKHH
jgi:hypothetical protein